MNKKQECIGQHYWHDFEIKDVTVKQVILNVTEQILTKSTLSVHKLHSKCHLLGWTHARSLPRHWSIA